MTYTAENPTRLPKIGEPIRRLKNGKWVVVGKVRQVRKVKGKWEIKDR